MNASPASNMPSRLPRRPEYPLCRRPHAAGNKSKFSTHKACLHRRLALEDHERLVFQTLVISMVGALSQRGRGATLG
jgi:hypothetical protein